jgi:hypothetical protein
MIATKALRLHDGRSLSFLEYGLAGGLPVLYFHGGRARPMSGSCLGATSWRRA